ncbi:MAG: hypothetical protein WC916_04860 [Candidatus Woesearchaeota archaeon]
MKHHFVSREIFIFAFILECIFLLVSIIKGQSFIIDGIFGLAFIGIFYIIEESYPLPPGVIIIGLIPVFLHSVGVVLGLFTLMFFGIGYDKYTHFINSFAITFTIFFVMLAHSKSDPIKKGIAALLIALGFGSFNEINEFVGSTYLNITGPTMFSQGDLENTLIYKEGIRIGKPIMIEGLPRLKQDFQVYDSYWDMIFNLTGALIALIALNLLWNFQAIPHEKRKEEFVV